MAGFYAGDPESAWRFGDVICGFPAATPQKHKPTREDVTGFTIRVEHPQYLAVMTPCCSIENKVIALAPLVEIRPSLLNNPYFEEDLTNVNRRVPPEKSVPPEAWAKMPPERRESIRSQGLSYVFLDLFIYQDHPLLARYTLHRKAGAIDIGHYLVDFKGIFRVECDLVDRSKEPPAGLKILQLTALTRKELRDKLSFYFGRQADEDAKELLG